MERILRHAGDDADGQGAGRKGVFDQLLDVADRLRVRQVDRFGHGSPVVDGDLNRAGRNALPVVEVGQARLGRECRVDVGTDGRGDCAKSGDAVCVIGSDKPHVDVRVDARLVAVVADGSVAQDLKGSRLRVAAAEQVLPLKRGIRRVDEPLNDGAHLAGKCLVLRGACSSCPSRSRGANWPGSPPWKLPARQNRCSVTATRRP